jgi:ribokinase
LQRGDLKIYDIITVGSSTIDVFGDTDSELIKIKTRKYEEDHIAYPSGVKMIIRDLNFRIGGGGVNTAVVGAHLGMKAAYLGCLGRDTNGDMVIRQLKRHGVDFVGTRTLGQTGYAIILDSIESDRTILKFSGANDELDYKDIDKSRLNAKWMYFCSMLGKSFTTSEKLAEYCRKKGIKVAFNPSNYICKHGKGYIAKMVRHSELFMVNEIEAYILTHEQGVKPQLRALHRIGAKQVLVTEGAEGAGYFNGKEYLYVKTHNIKAVEVTGAGDTFGSSFVTGLIKKPGNVRFALKLAVANAEGVIRKPGAHAGILTFKQAKEAMKKHTKIMSL